MNAVVFELPPEEELGPQRVDALFLQIRDALEGFPGDRIRRVTSYRGRPGVMLQVPEERLEEACERVRWVLWDASIEFVEHLYFEPPRPLPEAPPLHSSARTGRRRPSGGGARQVARRLRAGQAFCRLELYPEAKNQFLGARHLDPANAEAAYGLGVVEAHEGHLEEAERWLREAIALDAGQARFHYVLGGICHKTGRLEDAEGLLKRAVELDPDDASYFELLGWIYMDGGDMGRARTAFEQALESSADRISSLSGLGAVCFAEGHLDDSVAILEQALELDPEHAVARVQYAWCLFHLGDLDRAEEEFLQVLHGDNPDLECPTAFGLGRLYLQRGTLTLAVHHLELAASDDWAPARWMLGEALFLSGRFEEAVDALQEALALDPTLRGEVETRIALCYMRLGRLAEAESWIARIHEHRGPQGPMLELLGAIHGSRGDWEEAREALEEACRLEPDSAPAFFQLGWIAENLDEVEEAQRCYRRSLRLDPCCRESAIHLGWLFLDSNRLGEAAVVFENALEAHPEDPELLYCLGRTLYGEARFQRAAEILQRSLLRQPDSPETRAWFGAALVSLGQSEEGKREIRQALQEGPDEETRALCRRLLRRRTPRREPLAGRAERKKSDALKSVS